MTNPLSPEFQRASSASVREAHIWLLRNALQEHGDLFASCGVSLREAAYRGHDAAVLMHLRQLRRIFTDAFEAVQELQKVVDDLPGDRAGVA